MRTCGLVPASKIKLYISYWILKIWLINLWGNLTCFTESQIWKVNGKPIRSIKTLPRFVRNEIRFLLNSSTVHKNRKLGIQWENIYIPLHVGSPGPRFSYPVGRLRPPIYEILSMVFALVIRLVHNNNEVRSYNKFWSPSLPIHPQSFSLWSIANCYSSSIIVPLKAILRKLMALSVWINWLYRLNWSIDRFTWSHFT